VTFDCYGTLVDWQQGLGELLVPLAGARAPEVVRAFAGYQLALEKQGPVRPHKQVLKAALLCAAGERGVPLTDADARTLTRSWSALRPFADVEAMLAALRARGYRLGVLTNVDDDLFEITHRSFATPFNLFFTAERARGFKPEPWLFRGFERMTGVDRGDWVHVGSDWYHDIAPAQALGVAPVWLERDGTQAPGGTALRAATGVDVVRAIDQHFASRNYGSPGPRARGPPFPTLPTPPLLPTPPRMCPCSTSIGVSRPRPGPGWRRRPASTRSFAPPPAARYGRR
jgi:2-haloacid dehalogenase